MKKTQLIHRDSNLIYKANISNITRLRINDDGPGVRSVVFLCGCPLSCKWCCNPEICASESYRPTTEKELYRYIAGDMLYFENSGGGITFSGGEPLLNSEYIKNFVEKYCGAISVAIETSLYSKVSDVEKLYPLIDRWYVDFKVFDEQKHIEYTGVSNEFIKSNLCYLADKINKENITITYPIIPGYNTSDENLYEMMVFLKKAGIKNIELHPYRKIQEKKHIELGLPSTVIDEVSQELYEKIKRSFLNGGFTIPEENLYREKEKCVYLKAIRKKICKNEKIPLEIKICDFEGRCNGTCPQCEYELDFINKWRNLN